MKELMTVQQAAKVLQVHRSTIYRLSKEGKLPIIKPAPGISRVRMVDLYSLLDKAGTVYKEGEKTNGTG